MTISFVQTQLPCFDSYQFPLAVGFTEKMRSFKSISTNNQKRVYFFCERTISDQGVANRDKDQSTWENMRKTENIWGCLGLAILLWWQKKINVLNQKKIIVIKRWEWELKKKLNFEENMATAKQTMRKTKFFICLEIFSVFRDIQGWRRQRRKLFTTRRCGRSLISSHYNARTFTSSSPTRQHVFFLFSMSKYSPLSMQEKRFLFLIWKTS